MIKVSLVNPDYNYYIGSNNPKVGTKFECEGVLKSIKYKAFNYTHGQTNFDIKEIINVVENTNNLDLGLEANVINVSWDNGKSNSYKAGELKVINAKAAKCVSIW